MNEFRVQQLSKKYDSTPGVPAAGGVTDFPDESTIKCTMPEIYDPKPSTPGEIKKWRKSVTYQPGKTVIHPGMSQDLDHTRVGTYGIKVPMGAKVKELIEPHQMSALMAQANGKKESIYRSNKREPLGASYVRGHSLPGKHADARNPQAAVVPFGKPTPHDIFGDNAKNLVYPEYNQEDERDFHELYSKSHSQFAPGEQRRRGYEWQTSSGALDPTQHRFGVAGEPNAEGVAKALNPQLDPLADRPPRVVSKQLEDFKDCDSDELGKVRNLGGGDRNLPHNHVFGAPSQRAPEWGAKQCVTGIYSGQEQEPDLDLGRSVRPGWRNVTEDVRPFGCPSLRRDIAAPRIKSIADHQNYGGEPNAQNLLYPARFTELGVTEEDFLQACSMDQVKSIFEDAGIYLSGDEFEVVYKEAQHQDEAALVSIESFRRTMNEMILNGSLKQ